MLTSVHYAHASRCSKEITILVISRIRRVSIYCTSASVCFCSSRYVLSCLTGLSFLLMSKMRENPCGTQHCCCERGHTVTWSTSACDGATTSSILSRHHNSMSLWYSRCFVSMCLFANTCMYCVAPACPHVSMQWTCRGCASAHRPMICAIMRLNLVHRCGHLPKLTVAHMIIPIHYQSGGSFQR